MKANFLFILIFAVLSCGKNEVNYLSEKCKADNEVCTFKRAQAIDRCMDEFTKDTKELDDRYRSMFNTNKLIGQEYTYELDPQKSTSKISAHEILFKVVGRGKDVNKDYYLDFYVENKESNNVTPFCGDLDNECIIRYTTADHKSIMGALANYKCLKDPKDTKLSVDVDNERIKLKSKREYEVGNSRREKLNIVTRFKKSYPLIIGDFIKDKIYKEVYKKKNKKYEPVSGSPFKNIESNLEKVDEDDNDDPNLPSGLIICDVFVNSSRLALPTSFNLNTVWMPVCTGDIRTDDYDELI